MKIMPNEILKIMEKAIIEKYTDKLKELIFADDRIDKTQTIYFDLDINKAMDIYDKLYK